MIKSGTTLVRRYIGNYPKIFSGLESNWFRLDEFFNKNSDDIEPTLLLWSKFFDLEVSLLSEIIKKASCSEEVLDQLFNHLKERDAFLEWCDKSPLNIAHGERILSYWPEAKLINVIRDPLDIFCSLKESKNIKDPKYFVKKWAQIFSNLKDLRLNTNYKEIRYEDIILNKTNTLENLYKFCGLEWNQIYSNYKYDNSELEKVRSVTGLTSTTLERLSTPITIKRIGLHKKNLTSLERIEIENLILKENLSEEFNNALWQ